MVKKCPACSSSRITTNDLGDMSCKRCGYVHLSVETLFKQTQDELLQNSKK